jgi:triosephosphate isomerase
LALSIIRQTIAKNNFMKKKLIIANWKMNHSFEEADQWLTTFLSKCQKSKNAELVLCPPVIITDYLDSELMNSGFEKLEKTMIAERKKVTDFSDSELTDIVLKERPIKLGAQDCHHEISGSFTGDLSAAMLKKIGCEYVILGHSERREWHFENNNIVAKKASAALTENIIPIICVGESAKIRQQNQHLEFVSSQLLESLPNGVFDKLVIAYEPIWAIGSGITPTLAEMAELINKILIEKLPNKEFSILYGGSVNSSNSKEILTIKNIDGLLVGKASLDAEEFLKICFN